MTNAFTIRPAEATDVRAVYEVCLKTGDAGGDATPLYRDDPDALGHRYAGPYLALEPELAFVLEDDTGVCGYVLGALDSERFYQKFLDLWLPTVHAPEPSGDEASWTPAQRLYRSMRQLETTLPEPLQPYPSHLHIDLLPRAQRQGQGTRLMRTLFEALRAQGSPAVHLGVASTNVTAGRFYSTLGFDELLRSGSGSPHAIYLGRFL